MKRPWWISAACLLAALMLMGWGFRGQTEQTGGGARYIALMSAEYGTDALQFKQGAQDAARQLDASVSFFTLARNAPADAELIRLIDSLEPMDLDGLILPPCGAQPHARAQALAKSKSVALVCLFETDAADEIAVVSDDAQLGRQLGEAALARGAARFAALADAADPPQGLIEGLRDALGAVDVILCADAEQALAEARALPAGTACFALNAEFTLALGEAPGGLTIWGVDPGDERVSLLRGGVVDALGMRMPYAQGYLAVMAAATGAPVAKVPTRVVTRDTMYLSENVKLMFPLLQ